MEKGHSCEWPFFYVQRGRECLQNHRLPGSFARPVCMRTYLHAQGGGFLAGVAIPVGWLW